MKITLFAIGTRGDVQPMVALGAALDRGGHSVRLVAGDEFRSMGGVGGIDFVSLGSPFAELMRSSSLSSFVPKIRDIIVAEASARPDAMI